jgi:hypothetical protein
MGNTISPGYAIYDSVYSYCPTKTFVISSRHNVIFHNDTIRELLKEISEKYHFYSFSLTTSPDFIHKYFK